MDSPTVVSRNEKRLSPWVCLVEKSVQFPHRTSQDIYHCFKQADYMALLAITPNGLIPLVKQYRPAVETFTLELPAGLLEKDETPLEACRRELTEETGLHASEIISLGCYHADTGRLENQLHAFFVRTTDEPKQDTSVEEGLSVEFVDLHSLEELLLTGKFNHQLHIGLLTIAKLRNLI